MRILQILLKLAGSVLLASCHPVVPSDTCKQQMSACLAKCDPTLDAPDISQTVHTRTGSHNTMSLCERSCMNCGTKSSPPPQPAATPTGTPRQVPPNAVSLPQGIDINAESDAGDPGIQ